MAMIAENLEQELKPIPEDPPVVQQQPESQARGKKRGKVDTNQDTPPTKRTAIVLRPKRNISYKPCAGSNCGRCITCERMKR
jgi:hypothetical protein